MSTKYYNVVEISAVLLCQTGLTLPFFCAVDAMNDHISSSVTCSQENGKQHHSKKHKVKTFKKTPKRTDVEGQGKKSRMDFNDEVHIAKSGKKDREISDDRDKNETKDDQKGKLEIDMDFCIQGNGEKIKNYEKNGEFMDFWNAEKMMKKKDKKKKWINVTSTNYQSNWKKKRWRTKKNNNFSSSHDIVHHKFSDIGFSKNESLNQSIKDWKKSKKKNKNKSVVGLPEMNHESNRGHIYFDKDYVPSEVKVVTSSESNELNCGHIYFDTDEPSQFNNIISNESRLADGFENNCYVKIPRHIHFEKDSPSRLNAITSCGSSDKSSKPDKIYPNNSGKQPKCNTASSRFDNSDNVIKPHRIHFDKDSPFRSNAEIAKTKSSKYEPSFNCKKHIHFDDDLFPPLIVDENRFEDDTFCDKDDVKNKNVAYRDNSNREEIDFGMHKRSKNERQNKADKMNRDKNYTDERDCVVRDADYNAMYESGSRLEKDPDIQTTKIGAHCDVIGGVSNNETGGLNSDTMPIDCDDILKERNVSPARKHTHFDGEGENTSFESKSECSKNENHSRRKKNRKRKRKRHESNEAYHGIEQSDESFNLSALSSKHVSNSDIENVSANSENRKIVDNTESIESKEIRNKPSQSTCDTPQEITGDGYHDNRKKKKHREINCDTNSENNSDGEWENHKIRKKDKHQEIICGISARVSSEESRKINKKYKKKNKKHRERKSTISEDTDSRAQCDSIDLDSGFCKSKKNKKCETLLNPYKSNIDYLTEGTNSVTISNENVYVSKTDLGASSDPLCNPGETSDLLCNSIISSTPGKVGEGAFDDSIILNGQNIRDIESIQKSSSPQPVAKINNEQAKNTGEICPVPQWLIAGLPDYNNNNQDLYIPKEGCASSQNQNNFNTKFAKDVQPDFDPMFTPDVSESECESPRYLKKCRPALETCKESLCDIWNVLINQDRMLKDQAVQLEKMRGENRKHVKEKTELEDRVGELEILVKSLNKIIDEKDGEMSSLKQDFQYLQAVIEDNHGISINRESLSEIQGRITDSVSMIDTLTSFLQSSTFNRS